MANKMSAAERILLVASELFYREGIRAVGIDRVIDESKVAKASFYRNFPSKDDLVVKYLEYREELHLERLNAALQLHPDDPKAQLLAILESLVGRMCESNYRGCPFMNAAVEFPDPDHPAHRKAVEIRRKLWKIVEGVAHQGGASNPERITEQLRLLSSGAIMLSYYDRPAFHREHFMSAARLLIDQHL